MVIKLNRFKKRARDIEKGSEDYIYSHAQNYYPALETIFTRANFRGIKRMYIEVPEYINEEQFLKEVRKIWIDIQQSLKK